MKKYKTVLLLSISFSLIAMIIIPLIISVVISFQDSSSYIKQEFGFTSVNYIKLINNMDYLKYVLNTAILSFASAIILTIILIPASYSISQFKYYNTLIIVLFVIAFIPEQSIIYNEYRILTFFNLNNSLSSVVLLYVAKFLPETIIILSIFIKSIPSEIFEAAKLEKVSYPKFLYHIVFRLSIPMVTFVFFTVFICAWNEYLISAFMLYNDSVKTINTALVFLTNNRYASNIPLQTAAVNISMLPMILLYLIIHKKMIKNIHI